MAEVGEASSFGAINDVKRPKRQTLGLSCSLPLATNATKVFLGNRYPNK
jgi:hypothetical protein